jgi:prevent-host-death family protein
MDDEKALQAACGAFYWLNIVQCSILLYSYVATSLHIMEVVMTVTRISSRAFNQEVSRAKKAAEEGPVYITDRGNPAHVLLTFEAYKKLTGSNRSIVDSLAMPDGVDIDFEPERATIINRDVEF